MCIQSVRTLFVCGRRRRRWMRTKWIYSYFGGCHSHDTSARMTPFICTPPIVGVAALAWIGAAEIYCADSDGKLNVTHAQSKDWASRRAIKYTHFNRNLITMSMLTIKFVENVSFIAQTQNVCELIMLMREIKKKKGEKSKTNLFPTPFWMSICLPRHRPCLLLCSMLYGIDWGLTAQRIEREHSKDCLLCIFASVDAMRIASKVQNLRCGWLPFLVNAWTAFNKNFKMELTTPDTCSRLKSWIKFHSWNKCSVCSG